VVRHLVSELAGDQDCLQGCGLDAAPKGETTNCRQFPRSGRGDPLRAVLTVHYTRWPSKAASIPSPSAFRRSKS
jgi:hypothetical protein